MAVIAQELHDRYALYNGDCCEVLPDIKNASVHLSIHSPPFADLFNYSSSERDLSNCRTYDEFLQHYDFVASELFRVTLPGRIACVHCCDIPIPGQRLGYRDFPGDIIRLYLKQGFLYEGRIAIWKEPRRVALRTRLKHLTHKFLVRDSTLSYPAGADFLLLFKKTGENKEPVAHPTGLSEYAGERPIPSQLMKYIGEKRQEKNRLSQWIWRNYASSFWDDIRINRVLPYKESKEHDDEKHVCLVSNSLILTKERGYIPICEVAVGEHVLTHVGRWRPVMAVQQTGIRPVIRISAHGVPGLLVTPDHRLWIRKSEWVRQREGAEYVKPDWVEAQHSLGGYVNLPLPQIEAAMNDDVQHWWIVGRWLADGHWDAREGLHISCGDHELNDLLKRLGEVAGMCRHTGTSYQIRLHDPDGRLREIVCKCGHGASGKHLPPEAFVLPELQAKALLDGYLSGDGHYLDDRERWQASSVSRALVLGLAMLAQRVYHTIASVYAGRPERESQIDGRAVHCQQDWMLGFDIHDTERYKKPFILEDGAWKKVRSLEDAGEMETWNLRVQDDESYVAEGCVVKNCPLQLDCIERAVIMWSNPGDKVLTPFMGVGSEVYGAVINNRLGIGIELKSSFYKQAVKNVKAGLEHHKQGEIKSIFGDDLQDHELTDEEMAEDAIDDE